MGIMMLVWVVVAVAVCVVAVRLATNRLPPPPTDQHRLLAEQDERIEQLEDELRQVREQADFTEKLLTERSHPTAQDTPDETESG